MEALRVSFVSSVCRSVRKIAYYKAAADTRNTPPSCPSPPEPTSQTTHFPGPSPPSLPHPPNTKDAANFFDSDAVGAHAVSSQHAV
eukprot:9370284-Karenia_brevis.AAC.1